MRIFIELPLKANEMTVRFGESVPDTELRFRLCRMMNGMYGVHIFDHDGKFISAMDLVHYEKGYHTISTAIVDSAVIEVAVYERFHRWTISVAG